MSKRGGAVIGQVYKSAYNKFVSENAGHFQLPTGRLDFKGLGEAWRKAPENKNRNKPVKERAPKKKVKDLDEGQKAVRMIKRGEKILKSLGLPSYCEKKVKLKK